MVHELWITVNDERFGAYYTKRELTKEELGEIGDKLRNFDYMQISSDERIHKPWVLLTRWLEDNDLVAPIESRHRVVDLKIDTSLSPRAPMDALYLSKVAKR